MHVQSVGLMGIWVHDLVECSHKESQRICERICELIFPKCLICMQSITLNVTVKCDCMLVRGIKCVSG